MRIILMESLSKMMEASGITSWGLPVLFMSVEDHVCEINVYKCTVSVIVYLHISAIQTIWNIFWTCV